MGVVAREVEAVLQDPPCWLAQEEVGAGAEAGMVVLLPCLKVARGVGVGVEEVLEPDLTILMLAQCYCLCLLQVVLPCCWPAYQIHLPFQPAHCTTLRAGQHAWSRRVLHAADHFLDLKCPQRGRVLREALQVTSSGQVA